MNLLLDLHFENTLELLELVLTYQELPIRSQFTQQKIVPTLPTLAPPCVVLLWIGGNVRVSLLPQGYPLFPLLLRFPAVPSLERSEAHV